MSEPEANPETAQKPSFDPTASILKFPLFRHFGCLGVAIAYFLSGMVMVVYGLAKRDWEVAKGGLLAMVISILLAALCLGAIYLIQSTRQ